MALFGRGPEIDVLAALIAGVRTGGGAVLVRGAPGIGKSALLAEAAVRASAAGCTVVRVPGEQAGTGVPYAGLVQLAHSLGATPDTLAEPQRSALATALGWREATVPDVFLVGLATLNLVVESAARAPVLLIADDLQWLDDPTISVLAFMARRVRTEPILIIGAAREGYRSRLSADELTMLALPPLSQADAESLLDAIAPDLPAGVRRRVLDEAAGNPLALTELSRAAGSGLAAGASQLPLTERLERAFTDRLATLPGPAKTLLRMAAVNDSSALGDIIAAARLWAGIQIDPGDIDPAISAMLVDVIGAEVRFRHPLMRSAIHQSMTAADRRAAHAALAQVLPVGQEDRRIRHRAAATTLPDESVAADLADAAGRAARRGGVAAAVDALTQAAALSEDSRARTERLLCAADFAVELGQRDTMVRLLDEAAGSGLSPQQQVKVAWLRGSFDEGLRQQASNATTLTALAEEVAADGDVALAVRILWSAAQLCFWSEPGQRVRQLVLTAAEKLPLDELDPWLLTAIAAVTPAPALHADLRLVRAMLAPQDQAEALFEAALRADLTAWPLIRSRTQLVYGEWLRRHRRALESRDHLRAARDMFDALGAIPWSERARRELRAAGEVSRRRAPDARDQLTPHELQIAQLAAEGLTNREIGQRLYLSHRTVSSHLHRIFPKLGVASRSELRTMVSLSS